MQFVQSQKYDLRNVIDRLRLWKNEIQPTADDDNLDVVQIDEHNRFDKTLNRVNGWTDDWQKQCMINELASIDTVVADQKVGIVRSTGLLRRLLF